MRSTLQGFSVLLMQIQVWVHTELYIGGRRSVRAQSNTQLDCFSHCLSVGLRTSSISILFLYHLHTSSENVFWVLTCYQFHTERFTLCRSELVRHQFAKQLRLESAVCDHPSISGGCLNVYHVCLGEAAWLSDPSYSNNRQAQWSCNSIVDPMSLSEDTNLCWHPYMWCTDAQTPACTLLCPQHLFPMTCP